MLREGALHVIFVDLDIVDIWVGEVRRGHSFKFVRWFFETNLSGDLRTFLLYQVLDLIIDRFTFVVAIFEDRCCIGRLHRLFGTMGRDAWPKRLIAGLFLQRLDIILPDRDNRWLLNYLNLLLLSCNFRILLKARSFYWRQKLFISTKFNGLRAHLIYTIA